MSVLKKKELPALGEQGGSYLITKIKLIHLFFSGEEHQLSTQEDAHINYLNADNFF